MSSSTPALFCSPLLAATLPRSRSSLLFCSRGGGAHVVWMFSAEDQGREGGNCHLTDFQTRSHKEVSTKRIPCSSPTERSTPHFTRSVPSTNFCSSDKPVSISFLCINPLFPFCFSLTGVFSLIKKAPPKAVLLRAANRRAGGESAVNKS